MPGDGVSIPTTIAQLGNVAKTQARAQQTPAPVTPFSEQKDDQEQLKIQRVREATAAEKNRVAADHDETDRRKRRRLKRNRKQYQGQEGQPDDENGAGAGNGDDLDKDEARRGSLIDLRV